MFFVLAERVLGMPPRALVLLLLLLLTPLRGCSAASQGTQKWGFGVFISLGGWSFSRAEQLCRGEKGTVLLVRLCASCDFKICTSSVCTVNKQGCEWKNKTKRNETKNQETIHIFLWPKLKICFSVFKWWCNEEYFLFLFSKILE